MHITSGYNNAVLGNGGDLMDYLMKFLLCQYGPLLNILSNLPAKAPMLQGDRSASPEAAQSIIAAQVPRSFFLLADRNISPYSLFHIIILSFSFPTHLPNPSYGRTS